MRVREAMSAPVITLRPTDTLVDAARVMSRKGISSIVVTDDGNVVLGIVTNTGEVISAASYGPGR